MSTRAILRYALVCAMALTALNLRASGRVGGASFALSAGARAESMGGAFVAVADDVSTLYWNPGGLGLVRGSQLTGVHTEWIGGVRYEWVGFVQPIGRLATVGIGGKLLTGGDVPRTVMTLGGYAGEGVFRYSARHAQIAFGSTEIRSFRFGGGVELMREGLDISGSSDDESQSARSGTTHVGAIYQTPVSGLRVGAALRNLGGSASLHGDSSPLPRTLQVGAAYTRRIEPVASEQLPVELATTDTAKPSAASGVLTASTDLLSTRGESPALRAGLEYRFSNGLSARAGYRTDSAFDAVSRLSGGLGYATDTYQVDYAFLPVGDLGNAHRVAFTLLFR